MQELIHSLLDTIQESQYQLVGIGGRLDLINDYLLKADEIPDGAFDGLTKILIDIRDHVRTLDKTLDMTGINAYQTLEQLGIQK